MTISFDDQLRAATTEATALITAAITGGTHNATEGDWATQILDRLIRPDTTRCEHLDHTPIQPAFAYSWEGHFRCHPCHTTYRLPTDDRACDRCGTTDNRASFNTAVLRATAWAAIAALCPTCTAATTGQPATPKASEERVAAAIAQAAAKRAATAARRRRLQAAREHGLAARHRMKLARHAPKAASTDDTLPGGAA